jgi:hypothetical protein
MDANAIQQAMVQACQQCNGEFAYGKSMMCTMEFPALMSVLPCMICTSS